MSQERRFIADIRRIMHDYRQGKGRRLVLQIARLNEQANKKGIEINFSFTGVFIGFSVGETLLDEWYLLLPSDYEDFEMIAASQEALED